MWRKLVVRLSYGGVFMIGSLAFNGCLRFAQDNIEGIFAPDAFGNEGLFVNSILGRLLGL